MPKTLETIFQSTIDDALSICLLRHTHPKTEICILAGGQSRRMGRNKARLRLGRSSLLGHVKKAALGTKLPVRVIRRDLIPRCGPLGGIYTALNTTRADLLLFLPCDMPFVTSNILFALVKKLRPSHQALFVSCNDLIGFPFILRRQAFSTVFRQIKRRRFSLENLAKALDAKILRAPGSWTPRLLNLNTPQDLAVACASVSKFR